MGASIGVQPNNTRLLRALGMCIVIEQLRTVIRHWWEQIISWLTANPERSSWEIFQEMQRRSPDAITLCKSARESRGMRNIRAHLLETREKQWQTEVIHGTTPSPVSSAENPARILCSPPVVLPSVRDG